MTRPAMPWFRLRGSTIEDDDYLAMPLEQQAVYINLLCLACKERPRGSFQVKDLDRLARRVANGRRDVLEATLAYCTSEWQTRTGETTIDKLGRRDGSRCAYCGATQDLTLDHVVPRVRGGGHEPANLVPACRSCNAKKGGRTPEEARMSMREADA